jgi:hypothetical protein
MPQAGCLFVRPSFIYECHFNPIREQVIRWRLLLLQIGLVFLLFQSSFAASRDTEDKGELWISDGYGFLLEVRNDKLHTFELTSISCISGWSATKVSQPARTQGMVYAGRGQYRLLNGGSPGKKRLHLDGTASDIILRRTHTMPETCLRQPAASPEWSYAVFWETFAEQYPFFDLRKVDWRAVDRKFRPQVGPATKPEELFRILRQMIEPLQDTHTGLYAQDINKEFDGSRSDPGHLENDVWNKAGKLIETHYVRGGLRSYCKGRLQFGMFDHSIGYLRIAAFYGYTEVDSYESKLEALQSALDEVFANAQRLGGLVIDVRLNRGGDDSLGLEIASRLTSTRYLAYSKIARNNLDGPLHFTTPQETWVEPSDRPGFRGPVVLLTGPDTVSAGETFTMALLGRKPNIKRIGLNTQGVFSDVLKRTLPNGWVFHLPNEVYLTKERKAFDATGVPPDVRLKFFSFEDLNNGRDAALEAALRLLEQR